MFSSFTIRAVNIFIISIHCTGIFLQLIKNNGVSLCLLQTIRWHMLYNADEV